MGNVGSRSDEGAALYLRDQYRLSISSLIISSSKKRGSLSISPNAFPASRVSVSRVFGDGGPVEFVQDIESVASGAAPSFILKLANDDDLVFNFTFIVRQTKPTNPPAATAGHPDSLPAVAETHINGLTFVHGSTPREVENLVTREFHADPNLHKNSQVDLVGDYATGTNPSVTFEWAWKWKPPKALDDKGFGWRNSCSFVEYDARAHKLHTLASFSFWVSNITQTLSHPSSPTPQFSLAAPPRIRVGSAQSVDSRLTAYDLEDPPSPISGSNDSAATPIHTHLKEPVKVDVVCPKGGEDPLDDGPVFRATIKALEQKTGNMRSQIKKVLKRAEVAHVCRMEANDAFAAFINSLREAGSTNANAVQPAIEHYFDKIAREIVDYERQNTFDIQKYIIEPLNKVYTIDIKQADNKKREFEDESKDYYSYVSRYLGQRHDSVKAKKLAESDTKYQSKRRNFEIKRFDYSNFMQDLHGGRKEQEVLSCLTKYATAQTKGFLATAQRVDGMLPQLEALSMEVQEADKEYQYQRREREEKRRNLEMSKTTYGMEPEYVHVAMTSHSQATNGNQSHSDSELGRADSTSSQIRGISSSGSNSANAGAGELSRSPGSLMQQLVVGSPGQNAKFKGIRDLEERDPTQAAHAVGSSDHRKEGLLWAMSRPGLHVDPRNVTKQGWHKFWIVLDQGKLSEYDNWKEKLDLHMDPIDLRMASVREARNAERRFCFEIITPSFKRVYQATSEEDMNNWILAINNALQSAVEGRGLKDKPGQVSSPADSSLKRDIGSILTGKHSLSHGGHNPPASSGLPARRTTVGARPNNPRTGSTYDDDPDKLLQAVRDNDQGNCWCADCGSGSKVEWVSINLGIVLCIECSGIHRSLGTHISKVRSLTLDITSFTPDIVEILLLVGNRVSNMVWESRLDPSAKPTPQATREQRLKFITSKYVDRAYVEPISATLSRYATPDETLLAAIKKNEIQQVVYALALRANPNATDKSRGTHAVYLALAATDPAAPSSMINPPPAGSETKPRSVSFPVAEMMLQNGAELPATLPAFPLSPAALQYVDQKRTHASAVPTPSYSLSTGSSPGDKNRDRDSLSAARLQKRVSAGGRLAKSPIPER